MDRYGKASGKRMRSLIQVLVRREQLKWQKSLEAERRNYQTKIDSLQKELQVRHRFCILRYYSGFKKRDSVNR